MKYFIIYAFLTFYLTACNSYNYCKYCKGCTENIDPHKPYNVKSKYCIISISDTILSKDTGIIRFFAFNRIGGKELSNDYLRIGFYQVNGSGELSPNDSLKSHVYKTKENFGYQKLAKGKYIINIQSLNSLLRTEKIDVGENKVISISFYMGSSMVY